MMLTVADIADRLNACAGDLAPALLPNGRRAGQRWMFSGIDDSGRSESAWVNLSGPRIGKWCDMGNARAGEDKGDMIDLVRLREPRCRGEQLEAIRWAKSYLGIADDYQPGLPPPSREEMARREAEARARAAEREAQEARVREQKAKRAKALYLGAAPIAGTPAALYLEGRGIRPSPGASWPGSLRFHDEVWNADHRCKLPAMCAAIYRADGEQIGTHRTYLQLDAKRGWAKIAEDKSIKAKKVLGNAWGGFIPIAKGSSGKPMAKMPQDEPVYVTEGIEDALVVAMMKPEARVIAAISLGNVGAIVLPAAARRLIVVADRDTKHAAQEQLERSIARQQARGLDVGLVMPPASCNGAPVKDMNDWWLALSRAGNGERAA